MGESIDSFPLFPLGLVLLPGEVVPLHIFEERYRIMIGRCLDDESEFGIVWMSDDGLRDVGCAAAITEVVERMEDGRLNILVEGTTPFRLLQRVEDLEYPAGDIELLDDADDGDEDPEMADRAHKAYADLVEAVTDSRPGEEDLVGLDAYGMAATIAFDLEPKQELLELRPEAARLDRLASLCSAAMESYEYSQKAAGRAQSNGKVHH
jgi:Lon protease-like protein